MVRLGWLTSQLSVRKPKGRLPLGRDFANTTRVVALLGPRHVRCSFVVPPLPGGFATVFALLGFVLFLRCDSSAAVPAEMGLDWIGFGYAALVASGGMIGYAKAGSVPSLAAGLLFGGLAGLGAYQLSQDSKNIWLSLIASGTLAGIMGIRFYNSGKFMPAGLIAGASLLMVGRLGLKMYEKPHEG
nr:transmembrane protein 14C-like [Zootoca vivipara]